MSPFTGRAPASDWSASTSSRPIREAAMTQAERRIIEFLFTWNATGLGDLPDWFLALIENDHEDELSHELITAASFLFIRRERPGIKVSAARELLASYTADPTKMDELAERIQIFRLCCCFERLKRAGLYEDVFIADPFDPDGQVSVKLTEADWQFFNSNPTEQEKHIRMQGRWGKN